MVLPDKRRKETMKAVNDRKAEAIRKLMECLPQGGEKNAGGDAKSDEWSRLAAALGALTDEKRARFPLGKVVQTPGVMERTTNLERMEALVRHLGGDWGEVGHEDRKANEEAVGHGARILSTYRSDDGVRFWIITEADRSSTCILLPEEY